MRLSFTDRYIILFYTIIVIQQTSSAVVPNQGTASLYNSNDKVVVLTSQNFSTLVYQSKTAWLVEFYASWCGHCQSYANTYREVAIDALSWKTIVRIGAINCYAEENNDICEKNNIMAYPTLRLIPPETSFDTKKVIQLTANSAISVERELIKELDGLHRTDVHWPKFTPVNRLSFDELQARVPASVKAMFVIVEKHDDFIGRQIMLDFSKYYEQLTIFRATPDGQLWHNFQIKIEDIPALFVILPNRTIQQINTKQDTNKITGHRNLFHYDIRTYVHKNKLLESFNDDDLEEMIYSKNVLKNAQSSKILPNANADDGVSAVYEKINMIDLETGLSYMLRREIPRIKEIQGETYDALVHWLNLLVKYFPGREPVMRYIKNILSNVNQQPTGLTGQLFRQWADTNSEGSFLPNNMNKYQYCAGSSAQYRGYPCALWTLFHTLTVSQIESGVTDLHVNEIPFAIKGFIKYFFSCRHCSENFMKETHDISQIDSKDKYASVAYLWKVHNSVNRRLHGDESEDPKHPKIQFPSKSFCPKCHGNNSDEFSLSEVIEFLLKYYSKQNIDISSVDIWTKIDLSFNNDRPLREKYAMIEIDDETKSKLAIFHSGDSLTHSSLFYIFICCIVLIMFVIRRRYCKAKIKRYTL